MTAPSQLPSEQTGRGSASVSAIDPQTPPAFAWSHLLWLALTYFAAAQASLAFAIPPGYAAPLWPAAGLALVGLVVWGWRCWPAVWLGSFAANLVNQSVISGSETTPTLVALAALVAAGAALQAALGVRLVRRFVEAADPLAQERHALCFLALGGPLACLVSATLGVAGLYFLHGLPAEALAANWIAWWAGDSLGVLLFAPLVLLVLPESRRQWRGRALQIAVPLFVTGALVVAGYVWMNRAEEAAHRERQAAVAEKVHHDLDTALTRHFDSVQALASLFDASEKVTRAEFHTFSRSALGWSDVQALAWIPRVPRAQREGVEAAARQDGVRDFVFRERDSDNRRLVPAGERAEYYPALYIATREGKQSAALGFDAGAAAASRATLQRAMDSARPVLAEREAFYERDAARSDDWRLYVPVYRAGFGAQAAGVEARREALRGFTVGVFYINKLFAPMAASTGLQRIGYRLTNLSDPGSTLLLLERAVPATRTTLPDTSRRIEGLAGNSLLLETWFLAPWQPAQSATGQIYLLASVLITLLAAVFVLATAGQGVRVTREVSRRTAELERELEARRRAEESLSMETDRLALALANSNLSMFEANALTGEVSLDRQWPGIAGEEVAQDRVVTTLTELQKLTFADDKSRVMAAVVDLVTGRSAEYQIENRICTKTGELRWIYCRAKVVGRDEHGRAQRIIGTVLDITERKQVEETILRLNADLGQFKNTLDQTLDCIFMFRPDTLRFTYVNRGALAQVGYTEAELLQMTPVDIKPAFTEDTFRDIIRPLLDGTRASLVFETDHRHKDGHHIPVAISVQLVHQQVGQSTFVAIVRDLTVQKKLDAALRQSEEHLRSIVDNMAAFVGELTPEGVLEEVNRAALEMAGRRREDVLGTPFGETYWFSYSAAVQARMSEAIQRARDGEAVRFDVDVRVGDDRFITIDFMLVPVRDVHGRVVKLIPSGIDISERKRAEEEIREMNRNLECIVAERTASLRASERRFANLFEQAPDAVVMIDAQGRIKLVNRRAEALFGYSREELVGQAVEMLIPEGSRPQHAGLRQGFFRHPSARSMGAGQNLFALKKDGSTFPADISLSPVESEEGLLVAAAVRDVTAQKQAEEAIQRQGEFLRLMTENLAEGVVACDERGHLSFINKTARDWHGFDLLASPPEKWAEHYDLYEGDGTTPHATERLPLLRAFKGEDVRGAEMSIVAKGQPPRFIVASGSPLNDASGGKLGAVVVLHDVTERRQAAAAIEEQRQQLTEAQRLAHIGSWMWKMPTNEVVCSDEFLRLHGLAPQEIKPSLDAIRERMHPDDLEMLRQRFEQALQDHRPFDFDYRAVWPDGTVRWLHGRGEVLGDGAGRPEQVSGTAQDITEQREQEADRQARALAEQANTAKSNLLATMSHEIRTPLNGLLGLLELLQLSFLNDEQAAELRMAMDSGRSLARIIDDLLDYSKIEAGKLEIYPQPASVASIVEGARNTFLASAREKGLTLSCVIDARIRPVLSADALRLSQILNNFVSNALKFTEKGQVEIHAELMQQDDASDTVRLSVRDTGIGVVPEDQQRLFQPYEQAHGAIARMYGGTGLGLAICRRLTELMDGRIAMDSTPGQGTTLSVTFSLPVVEGQQLDMLALTPSETALLTLSSGGLPILAVDDHPTNRTLLQRQLGLIGLPAELAESGEQALARWREGRYALIITDCHMPHMDGYALTRAIRDIEGRENRPRIPVIAWTANAFPEDRTRCLAAGMDDFLAKPVELRSLQQTLSKWLPTAETPVAATGETTPTRINVDALNKLSGSSTEQAEILKEYQAQTRQDFEALKAALDRSDMPAVKRTAHSMKGASRMVGAQELAVLCEALEHSLRANDAGRRIALVAELTKALQRLEEAIRDYR